MKYAELEKGEETYKVWIEDADSMASRIRAEKYDSAGMAAWRRGFEILACDL